MFALLDGGIVSESIVAEFKQKGVELCCYPAFPDALSTLIKRGGEFDLVFITRFNVAEPLMAAARKYASKAKLILNLADLHYLREERRALQTGDENAMRAAESIRQRELAVMTQVDLVLSYTPEELHLIKQELGDRVRVAKCPWVSELAVSVPPFGQRRDVAFLGGFSHIPNVDAMVWFTQQVMPALRAKDPDIKLLIYGANLPPEVQALAGEGVSIQGFIEDLSKAYDTCRVFVAPLRFGAGLKGKVAGALSRGVPCVVSPIAAEGIGSADDPVVSLAHTPQEWVDQILRLYGDEAAWNAASRRALSYAQANYSAENAVQKLGEIVDGVFQ